MKSLETTWEMQSQTLSEKLAKIKNICGEKAELTTFINAVRTHVDEMN